jgi:hypothetical protein
MIKGILLSITLAVFVVSLIFVISSSTGSLQENIITGNVIGKSSFTNYSIMALICFFILFILIIFWMKKSFNY